MVAFSFLFGCLSGTVMAAGIWLWIIASAAVVLAVMLKQLGRQATLALVLLFFSLGALRTHLAMDLPCPEPGTYEISGMVYGGSVPKTDNRIAFVLTDVSADGAVLPGRAYCTLHYDDQPPGVFDGARVHFTGRIYQPDGKSGAPHIDFRMWMLQHDLAYGIAAYQELTIENTPQTASVADPWYRMRQAFSQALQSVMGDNARIATALLLGDRDGLTQTESNAFQQLGIAHVMSVSGLHVSILGGIVCWLMDRLRMSRRSQLPVMALFLCAYCATTGGSAASVRAAVMLMSYAFARLLLRWPDHLTVLGGSMLVVLLIDPLQACSAGFVLSFSAMLGITLHSHSVREGLAHLFPLPDRLPKEWFPRLIIRIKGGLLDLLTVSLCAQLGVLLPSMAYFHQLPLYGVVINLLIVPLVSLVLMPLYAAVLPLSLIPGLGAVAGWLASAGTDVLLWLVALLSRLPYASLRVAAPSAIVCIGLGLALCMLSRRLPGSTKRRAAAAALVVCLTLGCAWLERPAAVRYIQLSVGQADSALLLDGNRTLLIDCGSDGSSALDYLMDERRDIDALFITHLHMDHIGGVRELLDSPVRIHHVYLPVHAERQRADEEALLLLNRIRQAGIPVSELASGDELRYNKTSLSVLWPDRETVRQGHPANEMPLVIRVDLNGYTLLCASDLEGIYENYAAVPADVLKVAHHGSAASTGENFLRFVSPDVALISCTYSSSYLPGQATLERLRQAGIAAFRTDQCGDITLSVADGQLTVIPYKAR